MKLGDLKIETLKIMFVGIGDDISIDNLSAFAEDEVYRGYLVNMTGAINRCFSSLEEKRVLPVKTYRLLPSDGLASGKFVRFDLSNIDMYDIERVIRSNGYEYEDDCDYRMEGQTLVLEPKAGDEYTAVYYPTIERVLSSTGDETELTVPESIASYIPYFLKGDLYRDDEPNEASEARNWYEQSMREIAEKKTKKQGYVKTTYSQTEL